MGDGRRLKARVEGLFGNAHRGRPYLNFWTVLKWLAGEEAQQFGRFLCNLNRDFHSHFVRRFLLRDENNGGPTKKCGFEGRYLSRVVFSSGSDLLRKKVRKKSCLLSWKCVFLRGPY